MIHGKLENFNDKNGNAAGGYAKGIGIDINWQSVPLKEGERNGAIMEDILEIVLERLKFHQNSKFSCRENTIAFEKIKEALISLKYRTLERKERGVEGHHKE